MKKTFKPLLIAGALLLPVIVLISAFTHLPERKKPQDNHLQMLFYNYAPEQRHINVNILNGQQTMLDLEENKTQSRRAKPDRYDLDLTDIQSSPTQGVNFNPGIVDKLVDGEGSVMASSTKLTFEPGPAGFLGKPDQMIAVGMKYIIVCTDHRMAFYDKSGNALPAKNSIPVNMSMTDFFGAFISDEQELSAININKKMNLPAACKIDEFYDARVEYSSLHKRFFILTHVRNDNDGCDARFFGIAVSKTEDPRDGFYQWVSTTRPYGDWPRIGLNGNYFIYTWNGKSEKGKTAAHIFSINDLKAGNPNPHVWTFDTYDFLYYGGGMTPLNVPGAPSNVTYFMRLENDPNKVHLYAFENTADFNTKPQLMHADKVSGRPFSMLRCSNMTLRNGRIYVTCTQKVSDRVPNVRPGRSDIRVLVFPVKLEEKTFPSFGKYIHFSLDDGPGQRDLVFGRNNPVDDKPGDIFSYEAPAMAVNKDGDIVVVYARVPVKTAPGAFSDTRYTTIYHNEIKQRPSIQLHAGEFLPQTVYDCDHGDTSPTVISYNDKPGSNGYLIDLGCAVVDPEDDRSFWVIHCYAKKPKKEPYYHKNDQAGCYKFEAFSMPVIGKIKL